MPELRAGGEVRVGVVLSCREYVRDRDVDALSDDQSEQVPGEIPRGDGDDESADEDESDVRSEQSGSRDRAGVRGHEDVHGGERHGRRHRVEQQRSAEAACDREDDRQHDDEPGIEEDREAEEQRGHTEGEGCSLLTEEADEGVGEHLGAAGEFEHPPEHRAESHEQGDAGQGGSEAVIEDVDEVARHDSCGQSSDYGDDDEGDEGMHSCLDDEQEQHGDGRGRDSQQGRSRQSPGQFEFGHCSSSLRSVRWADGGLGDHALIRFTESRIAFRTSGIDWSTSTVA